MHIIALQVMCCALMMWLLVPLAGAEAVPEGRRAGDSTAAGALHNDSRGRLAFVRRHGMQVCAACTPNITTQGFSA